MAQEEGLVATITENGWAQVVTDRRDACADCGASHCCASLGGSSKMVIKALNRAGAGVGDLVYVNLGSGAVIQSAASFYMIPLLALIAGAVVGTELSQPLSISETAGAILFSFVGLALGFLITALISRRMSSQNKLTPIITRIKRAGAEAPESLMSVDPVCKMLVEPAQAPASHVYRDKTYYFCHPNCKESFAKDPEKYLTPQPKIKAL